LAALRSIDAKDPCAAKTFPQGNAMQTSKKRLELLFAIPQTAPCTLACLHTLNLQDVLQLLAHGALTEANLLCAPFAGGLAWHHSVAEKRERRLHLRRYHGSVLRQATCKRLCAICFVKNNLLQNAVKVNTAFCGWVNCA